MSGNEKGQIAVRLDDEDRRAIDQLIIEGEYENISAFMRQAVKDKLNPKMRKARERKVFSEMLEDPDVLAKIREGLLAGDGLGKLQRKLKPD
jgi:Arc/MetJ-type ribon-helix-helix transcriptional regulator